ncbi:competence type IV pilus major pilin ComGC [Virgibacillus salexigens]|uniref:ComG operon protein 3 n=3 Tax=Bacillaceae TaxID=186817 RepID=A0A024QAW0_9BACI|nr:MULTISPECIES: competence type IV pilus major pilin ComGC [Virgibacillus]GGJ47598.1 hypothetical protein GCM10007111_07030 [Virgibacillus kapii]CDQ39673.1 ComG operon protein 3 precursor [Virgibacillus massiliensis]
MLKNNRGFTLIEMLIVLMIISVLIILTVPNLSKRSQEVSNKGCDALLAVVQAQVDAYYTEHNSYPISLESMIPAYINEEQTSCNNDEALLYDKDTGKVRAPAS